jgi:hypothetical protein
MHHSTLERKLTNAEKWVAQSHDRVTHQRAVVLQHQDKGLDSAIARAILEQLETSQRTCITNRDRLLEQVGQSPGGSRAVTGTEPFRS